MGPTLPPPPPWVSSPWGGEDDLLPPPPPPMSPFAVPGMAAGGEAPAVPDAVAFDIPLPPPPPLADEVDDVEVPLAPRAMAQAEARAAKTGRELAPPPIEPDRDLLVDDGLDFPGMAEIEEDGRRMVEKTTADVEDEAAAQAEADRWAKVQALAEADPETWALVNMEHQLRQEHERAIRERQIVEDDRARQEENARNLQKATEAAATDRAALETEAKQLADGSPFSQWWPTRTALQKVVAFVQVIAGGFLQSRVGGRNTGLDLLMKEADDTAAAKWASLRERRGLANERAGAAQDDFRQREALRLASREQAIRAMETELQTLDPQGTQALRLAAAIREGRAQQAAAMAAFGEASFKQNLEVYKADSDRMRAESDALRARAEAAKKLGLGGGGGGGTGAGFGNTVTYEQMKANGWRIPAGLTPGQSMKGKDYKAFLSTEAANGNIERSEAERQSRELDQELKLEALTIPLPNGIKFRAKSDAEAVAGRQKVFAARQLTNYIDEAMAIRDAVGGESSWANSPEYGRFQVLAANILKLTKADTQGMSSDADMAVLKAAAGADNIDSFRSQVAKLSTGRALIEAQLNGYLKDGQGYEGPPIELPNLHKKPPAKPDPAAKKLAAQSGPKIDPPTGKIPAGELLSNAGAAAYGADGELTPEMRRELRNAPDPLFDPAGARGISAEQNEGLEAYIQGTLAGDEAAARKLVAAARNKDLTPRARKAAKDALGDLVAEGNPTILKVTGGAQ
jgi:hypothetical protein